MGFITTSTASGSGSLSLGGMVSVNEIAGSILTPATFGTLTGTSPIRRAHQQGWYGVGFAVTGGPFPGAIIIMYSSYITLENWSDLLKLTDTVPADTLYYELQEGCVMYLEVDW